MPLLLETTIIGGERGTVMALQRQMAEHAAEATSPSVSRLSDSALLLNNPTRLLPAPSDHGAQMQLLASFRRVHFVDE